jgi:hypothetical protein
LPGRFVIQEMDQGAGLRVIDANFEAESALPNGRQHDLPGNYLGDSLRQAQSV